MRDQFGQLLPFRRGEAGDVSGRAPVEPRSTSLPSDHVHRAADWRRATPTLAETVELASSSIVC